MAAKLIKWMSAMVMMAVAISACPAVAKSAEPTTVVRVDPVRVQTAEQTMPVIGRLVAKQGGDVAARAAGLVGFLPVDVGDRVAAGDLIARLKSDRLTAERDLRAAEAEAAAAAVTAAQAELDLRRQEYDRLAGLRTSPAFSVGQFDDKAREVQVARSRLAEAQGNRARARAQTQLAEIALEDAEIRAPYDGVVTRRHTEVGEYLDVGDPIVRLVGESALEIEADVPGNRLDALTPGATVAGEIAGVRVTATVRAVLPEENPQTRTRIVRFVTDLQGGGFAANQDVVVHVPLGRDREVLTVHKDAVLHRGGRYEVFVAADGGTAQLRPVTIGDAIDSRFVVRDGLSEGELVVVRGNERLYPGQSITVGNAPQG